MLGVFVSVVLPLLHVGQNRVYHPECIWSMRIASDLQIPFIFTDEKIVICNDLSGLSVIYNDLRGLEGLKKAQTKRKGSKSSL